MMAEAVFMDTWGWLALGHRKNTHNQQIQDKTMISFTDLTTMVIMEERGIRQIITEDEHFHHVGMDFQKVPQIEEP